MKVRRTPPLSFACKTGGVLPDRSPVPATPVQASQVSQAWSTEKTLMSFREEPLNELLA